MTDLDAMIRAKSAAEADLLKRPGVTGVGVGYREKGGQLTEELAIRVYIQRKRPPTEVPAESLIPTEIGGFKTDVIEKDYDVLTSLENFHQRPIVGGLEISRVLPADIYGFGSVCCFVNKVGKTGTYLLSAAHVLAPETTPVDDLVYQPRPIGFINKCAEKADIAYAGTVDAGLARLEQSIEWTNDVYNVGRILGIGEVKPGDNKVRKQGRTTELTSGFVTDFSYAPNYADQDVHLTDLLLIGPDPQSNQPQFCDLGDSGGPVFKDVKGVGVTLVGIVHGKPKVGTVGYACKIRNAFEALGIQLAAHSGKGDQSYPDSAPAGPPPDNRRPPFWVDRGTPPPHIEKTADGAVLSQTHVSVEAIVGVVMIKDEPWGSVRYELPLVFVRGSDGHLWANMEGGWTDLRTPPDATVAEGVGALTDMNGRRVFVRDSDGQLWEVAWDPRSNVPIMWGNHGTPPPRLIKTADDHFVQTPVTVERGVGVLTVKASPTASPRPYVFVGGSDGHLWMNWWDGNSWLWADQGTPTDSVTVAAGVGVTTIVDNPTASQRPHVWVRGSDGHLWLNWWNGNSWLWLSQGEFVEKVGVVSLQSDPTGPQLPYAFVPTSDGFLWTLSPTNDAYGAWYRMSTTNLPPGGVRIAAGLGATTVMDRPTKTKAWPGGGVKRPIVFVQGRDGHLWIAWYGAATNRWYWLDQGIPPGYEEARVATMTTEFLNPGTKEIVTTAQSTFASVRGENGHLWGGYFDPSWCYDFDAAGNPEPPE